MRLFGVSVHELPFCCPPLIRTSPFFFVLSNNNNHNETTTQREDLALPEERRRRMFYAEAHAIVLEEGRDATNAKAAVEVKQKTKNAIRPVFLLTL